VLATAIRRDLRGLEASPVIASVSEAIQSVLQKRPWIASAYAQERFGGLLPRVARTAIEEGSSLALLAIRNDET
jgi:hypothetical protein